MIKREEVEALLPMAECWGRGEMPIDAATLAELVRTWLRVNDAPIGTTKEKYENWKRGGQTVVSVECDGVVPVELLKRHRLVPEADSGGDRG